LKETTLKRRAPDNPVEHPNLGLERIVFFSDAVMAIAITLLVIDLKLPDLEPPVTNTMLLEQLQALTPRIVSFVISFAVVGIYWSSHHRYFRLIKRFDGRLIGLNLIFLFFVALMPFFASLLGQFGFLPLGVIAYGLAVSLIGFSIGAIWWYASWHHRLIGMEVDPTFIRNRNLLALIIPLVFLLSVPFAWINPLISMLIWWVAPFISLLMFRLLNRKDQSIVISGN
jgi:uncharacterized membrane protein